MGYRSKVIIGVKEGKLSKGFEDILSKHDIKLSPDWLRVCVQDGMKIYTFYQIKWYTMDSWCTDIMDYLEKIYNNEEDDVFCIGLGEDGITHSEIGEYWEFVDEEHTITLIN